MSGGPELPTSVGTCTVYSSTLIYGASERRNGMHVPRVSCCGINGLVTVYSTLFELVLQLCCYCQEPTIPGLTQHSTCVYIIFLLGLLFFFNFVPLVLFVSCCLFVTLVDVPPLSFWGPGVNLL